MRRQGIDRRFLAAVAAVVVAAVVAVIVTLQVSSNDTADAGLATAAAVSIPEKKVDYLFSHAFASGTLVGPDDRHLTLTLHGLPRYVTAFTDRPARSANVLADTDFFRLWKTWFKSDAPNAVLTFTPKGSKEPVGVVVTLMNPRYERASRTVTYDAVRIEKGDRLFPGARTTVVPSGKDPDFRESVKSFGQGVLVIDDASSLKTTFTGFFNSTTTPSVGTAVSNITLTPSIELSSVNVTGSSGGTVTGTVTMAIGGPSAASPLQVGGTFSWTDANDWTITLDDATGSSGTTAVTGTISDSAGTLAGALQASTTLGNENTPVSLDLTYDGVGNFTGTVAVGDFTIENTTFSGVTATFSTADPALSLDGTITTTKVDPATSISQTTTYDFTGNVSAGTFSLKIDAVLPTDETENVTLSGTTGSGLTGSIALTNAVIGGTTYPSLTLTFDTEHGSISAAGTMETDLGTFSGSFNINDDQLTQIGFTAMNLMFGDGLELDFIMFSADLGTTADSSCDSGKTTSFDGSSHGQLILGGANTATFWNDFSMSCGSFDSEEFQLNLTHTVAGDVEKTLEGTLWFSADGGTIQPCPATTSPLDNGCGSAVPYIVEPITSTGPFFYGSVAYGPSVSETFRFGIAGGSASASVDVQGSLGIGIAAYTTGANGSDWASSIGFGGEVGADISVTYLSQKYNGSATGGVACDFVTANSDFACDVGFKASVSASIAGKTYAYYDNFTDSTSF